MSTVTPTGFTNTALSSLRAMIAASTTFQGMMQKADAAAAIPFVYQYETAGDPARPFAVVQCDELQRQSHAGGSRTYYIPSGKLSFKVEYRPLWNNVPITAVVGPGSFTCASLALLKVSSLVGLYCKVLTGVLAGEELPVGSNAADGALTVNTAFSQAPSVNDTVLIYAKTDEDYFLHCMNLHDALISDIELLSGTGGYINLTGIHSSNFGKVRDDQTDEDYFGFSVVVNFGV